MAEVIPASASSTASSVSVASITSTSAASLSPLFNPGLEWAKNLKEYEISRLQGMISGAIATSLSEANLIDFVRYLNEALKRQSASGYSMTPYQLAEDTAKLILGQTTYNFPGVNAPAPPAPSPEYSSRTSVDETKFVALCEQMKALERKLTDLRDEVNHKDKSWGVF